MLKFLFYYRQLEEYNKIVHLVTLTQIFIASSSCVVIWFIVLRVKFIKIYLFIYCYFKFISIIKDTLCTNDFHPEIMNLVQIEYFMIKIYYFKIILVFEKASRSDFILTVKLIVALLLFTFQLCTMCALLCTIDEKVIKLFNLNSSLVSKWLFQFQFQAMLLWLIIMNSLLFGR